MRKYFSEWVSPALMMAPVLLLLGACYLLPFIGIARWSVTLPEPGFEQYKSLATDPLLRSVFIRTMRICALVTLISVTAAYAIALVWVRGPKPLRVFVEFCILVPFWISVLTRAFGWVALLSNRGLINVWAQSLGFISQPLELVRNEFGVVVGMSHFLIPFAVFPIASAIRSLDDRVLLAARGMGAGNIRIFWSVLVPMTKAGIIGASLIVFVFALGFFITPAILGGGRSVMIAELIYLRIFQTPNWGLGAAMSVVLILLVAGLMFAMRNIVNPRRMV